MISIHINSQVILREMHCVFLEVGPEVLNITHWNFVRKGAKRQTAPGRNIRIMNAVF
jgi:hypothetical protein